MSKSYRAELVGVFGDPIDENPTVAVEEAAFRHLHLDWRYLTIRVKAEDLGAAMAGLKAMNMAGVNLTIPHKCEALKYLDELSEAARIIGAVNVVVNRDGRLWGDNTDGKGFLKALRDAGHEAAGRRAMILGAGGAARAIAVELALAGAARVDVVNRSAQRGEALARLLREKTRAACDYHPWTSRFAVPEGVDFLVNATSVGLYPAVEQCPDLDMDSIRPGTLVCDVVTNPPETAFLRAAAARGAQTIDGMGMLVNQGAINFELWTGREAPREVMMRALRAEFGLESK